MSLRSAIAAIAALLVLLGVPVSSDLTARKRAQERELREYVDGTERYVDLGVELATVVADPCGVELIPGKPPLRVVARHYAGGIYDRVARAIVAPSRRRVVWYASAQQVEIILHRCDRLGELVHGSEGSGKTSAAAMWIYFRWLELLGSSEPHEGGVVAPTHARLEVFLAAFRDRIPASWYRYRRSARVIQFVDGTRVRLVSAHRQSAQQGSPIQGFNWSFCVRDEAQDLVPVHEDIESRGRSAPNGRYLQLATATGKDDPAWRTLRDVIVASGQWSRLDLSIFSSPFVDRRFIEAKRLTMTDREFRRRYGDVTTGRVEDLALARALYLNWSRKENLRPIPHVGARKITSFVLREKTGNSLHALLCGHDPGAAKGGSIFLEAFELAGQPDPVWWVRGEIFHERATNEQAGRAILEFARKQGFNRTRPLDGRPDPESQIVHVRAQPFGQAEDKPSENLYLTFRRVGLDVKAAQFKKDATGTGVIKKDDRIELVNRLFCDASGRRRLFVECDEHGRPVAPRLVEALETMERDERGRAEHERKDDRDKSDLPAALGYALWPFEKEAATELRAQVRRGIA